MFVKVSVNVESCLCVGLSEPVLEAFHIPAFVYQQGGTGVPEFVQGDLWPSKSGCGFLESRGYVVWSVGSTVFPCEDIAVLVFVIPFKKALLLACSCLISRRQFSAVSKRLRFRLPAGVLVEWLA